MAEYHGPFSDKVVTVDGRRVPFLTAHHMAGTVSLTLDRRYGLDLPVDLADAVIDFIAQAIAIGMGYSCFPRDEDEPIPYNHFGRLLEITSAESAPTDG